MNKKSLLPEGLKDWLLLCLPLLSVIYFSFQLLGRLEKIDALDEQMTLIAHKKIQYEEIQKRQNSMLTSLVQADPQYIDNNLETLNFLEAELKKMQATRAPTDPRLQFLKEGENRLIFSEEKIRTKGKMREVYEKQQHPVEMDEEDLKRLLCLVEGITIWPYGPKEGHPQLIIQDFHLRKKSLSPQESVFIVNMNLIKRENNNP